MKKKRYFLILSIHTGLHLLFLPAMTGAPPFLEAAPAAYSGIASWYSEQDDGVRKHTANGERFEDSKKTCASWHYDFGSCVEVTNRTNRQSVICRINDRGPAKKLKRLIDLSKASFRQIARLEDGLVRVMVREIHP